MAIATQTKRFFSHIFYVRIHFEKHTHKTHTHTSDQRNL